jgi:hypothetical protein
MVGLPAAFPVSTPVPSPSVAFPTSLLVHTPPVLESLSIACTFTHTGTFASIAVGKGCTVAVIVAIHDVGKV